MLHHTHTVIVCSVDVLDTLNMQSMDTRRDCTMLRSGLTFSFSQLNLSCSNTEELTNTVHTRLRQLRQEDARPAACKERAGTDAILGRLYVLQVCLSTSWYTGVERNLCEWTGHQVINKAVSLIAIFKLHLLIRIVAHVQRALCYCVERNCYATWSVECKTSQLLQRR